MELLCIRYVLKLPHCQQRITHTGRKPLLIPRGLAHFHACFRASDCAIPLPSVLDVEDVYSVFTAITIDSNTGTHKLKSFDPVKLHVTKGNNGTSIRSRCWDCVLWLPLALHCCHRCQIQTSRLYLHAEAVWSYHHLNEGSTILGLFELSLAANSAAVHCEGFRAL